MAAARTDLLTKLRAICLGLPETTERLSHGTPTFFVRDKATFVYAWVGGHHDHEFAHLWCAAAPGVQEARIATDPSRYFRPPYVGHQGWIGVRLDGKVDWDEIGEVCEDAYRVVAPKRPVTLLDDGSSA